MPIFGGTGTGNLWVKIRSGQGVSGHQGVRLGQQDIGEFEGLPPGTGRRGNHQAIDARPAARSKDRHRRLRKALVQVQHPERIRHGTTFLDIRADEPGGGSEQLICSGIPLARSRGRLPTTFTVPSKVEGPDSPG